MCRLEVGGWRFGLLVCGQLPSVSWDEDAVAVAVAVAVGAAGAACDDDGASDERDFT